MRFGSERDLRDFVYDRWQAIREQDLLSSILPRCTTHQWVVPDIGTLGYVTMDYHLHRERRISGALGADIGGAPFLTEHYWSVRTLNGTQDPDWQPSFNVHVIELKNEPLIVPHCEILYRYATALRAAAILSVREAISDEARTPKFNLRAVLIGPEITEDAAVVHAFGSMHELPLVLAEFSVSPGGRISFREPEESASHWLAGYNANAAKQLGDEMFGGDQMLLTKGHWAGINDGPVFDAQTGLTIHKGRVL